MPLSLSLKLASVSPKHVYSRVVMFQSWSIYKGDTRLCPLKCTYLIHILNISVPVPIIYHPYNTLLSLSPLPPPHHIPPLPPPPSSPSLSLSLATLDIVRPAPTILLTPTPQDVAPPPDIYPVSSKWLYTGCRYYGGGWCVSPSTPSSLPTLPCPVSDGSTYPPQSSLAESLPFVSHLFHAYQTRF